MGTRKDVGIGGFITWNDVKLEVVEVKRKYPTCSGCFFEKRNRKRAGIGNGCFTHPYSCTAHFRKDKKNVVFKEIGTV